MLQQKSICPIIGRLQVRILTMPHQEVKRVNQAMVSGGKGWHTLLGLSITVTLASCMFGSSCMRKRVDRASLHVPSSLVMQQFEKMQLPGLRCLVGFMCQSASSTVGSCHAIRKVSLRVVQALGVTHQGEIKGGIKCVRLSLSFQFFVLVPS